MRNVNIKKIAIYDELPDGGGRILYRSHLKTLREKGFRVVKIKSDLVAINGLLTHYWNIIKKYLLHYSRILKEVNACDLLIAYQSWITKSPFFLFGVKVPIVYICNEPPREFYDHSVIRQHTLKESLVNSVLLFPIRVIDYLNIRLARDIKIVTISHLSAELIKKAYNIEAKVFSPGIEINGYRSNKPYSLRKNQVISVGALNKIKNQMHILHSVSLVPHNCRPTVVFVGDAADHSYVNKLIQYAIDHRIKLKIYSKINRTKLITLYRESKLFLFSPVNEPYGLVILEAMRAGLPLITNREGGYLEILSGTYGKSIEENAQKWASAIIDISTNKRKWKQYSDHNYHYVEKYSSTKTNLEIFQYIINILK